MYKQGDIVFVPYPYTDDLTATKQRPVVILSRNSHNRYQYIVAKITSVIRNDSFSFPIFNHEIDFSLDRASEVRVNDLATISHKLFKKKLGAFTKDGLQKLLVVIQDNFVIE
jgi:mRNA interferase MazF